MEQFFTIIGGMGTLATESFINLLNERTPIKKDQDYLNYILVNHATVPDRTEHIMDHSKPSFLPPLLEDIKQQSLLKPDFFVMVCNTAHYYYKELQEATDIPLIHMPHLAVSSIKKNYPSAKKIGLIATKGTIADHIYEDELKQAGYDYSLGDQEVQDQVESLIYDDIKENGQVDSEKYYGILRVMKEKFDCDAIILGCTELSFAQAKAPDHEYSVIDAQSIIADKTIELALKIRNKEVIDFESIY
ncbi:amino acid racemase [Companilactobacillus metriopterae]|uniref:amino acid racemase n=1 Tax=Companilactobacillus metriopterae TaxID=1909267 RepID=UPI00100A4581|nr:amino acid racemase [Companilactobacillus metriopterae]